MSIIRSPRPAAAYTVIQNDVLRDPRLSMRALGLLVRLLSRPDNWETNSEALAREFRCGRDQMRGVLRELADAGYMRLEKVQDEKTGLWSSRWVVFDEPGEPTPIGQPDCSPSEPAPENPDAGKPAPENPYAGFPGPSKKERLRSTDKSNTPPTPPDGGAPRKKPAPRSDLVSAEQLVAEGVDPVQAEGWLELRRKKRLPLTPAAWLLTKEGGREVGLSPAETVKVCNSRGWGAFRADWYTPPAKPGRPAAAGGPEFRIEDYGPADIRRI